MFFFKLDEQKTIDALKTNENYEGPSETIQLKNSSPELRKVKITIKVIS